MSTANAGLYYRLSGRAPIGSVIAIILLPCAVSAVTGAIYGMLLYFSPVVYLNLLGTLGVGFLGGWLVRKIGMATRVRQYGLYMAAAALAGVVSVYTAWIGWLFVLSESTVIILSPWSLLAVAGEIGEVGVWSIGHSSEEPVSGVFLYLVWAVEACLLIGFPLVAAHKIADEAYCEKTGKWLRDSRAFGPFAEIEDHSKWRMRMEANDFGALAELSPAAAELLDGSMYTTVTMRHAGAAESTHILTVDHVTLKIDKKGKVSHNKKPIVRNMLIDRETYDQIDQVVGSLGSDKDAQGKAATG